MISHNDEECGQNLQFQKARYWLSAGHKKIFINIAENKNL